MTALLTLALGIGASTAIFAVLDAVLLQPLPFAQPDRLVAIMPQPEHYASIPTMQDYLRRSTSFARIAAYRQWSPAQKTADGVTAGRVLAVSQDFFATLGARFALGSGWQVKANEEDCSAQAVVSGGYWRRLGGGSALAGRALNLAGRAYPIVGVLPVEQAIEGQYALNQPEVFVEAGCDPDVRPAERGMMSLELIGRLRPGVTTEQAAADLRRVELALHREYPNDYGSVETAAARPLQVSSYLELLVGAETKPALLIVMAACGLLLLIACANLANLLLARNTRRRSEFATRATLGATLGQLFRQLLAESAVLVALGAGAGVALASGVLRVLRATTALPLPRLAHASMRPTVLAVTIAVAGLVTVFLTVLPAWRTLRPGLIGDMQGTGRSSAGRSLRVAGRLLVVAQLTLTVVLLACAGWMIGGVYLLLHEPLGFAPEHLLMASVGFEAKRATKDDGTRLQVRFGEAAEDLRRLPGVLSVAVTDHPPLGHAVNRYDFCADVHPERCKERVYSNPDSYAISPGYFATIEQPLLAGRDFNAADDGRNHVVIVNQALAAREWPGESALGHRVRTGEIHAGEGESWATVVGVVGSVHSYDLISAPGPDLYLPRAEDPGGEARVIVRVSGEPAHFKEEVRRQLKARFPDARVHRLETMEEEMSSEVTKRVLLMRVAVAFGVVALVLSLIGTYGLLAYEVSLRDREIGIRLALGSSRERIVRLLLQEEGRWLVAGATLGLLFAVAAGYVLRSRFYGTQTTSLPVLIGSTLVLLGPAFAAVALPARRASRQDPAETLRRE